MTQLTLLTWETMTEAELAMLLARLRNHYYHIRNLRKGRFGQAKLRKEYRGAALLKRKLLLCGVDKRDVLDLIACCRLQCSANRQPFLYCKHCGQGRQYRLA